MIDRSLSITQEHSPVATQQEVEFTMMDQPTSTIAIVESIVLGGLALLAAVRLVTNEWIIESWLWVTLLVTGVTLGAHKIAIRISERSMRLICGPRSLRLVCGHQVVEEVLYSSVKSYSLNDPNSPNWLVVERRDSDESFRIPGSWHVRERGAAAKGLVKMMGPRLPVDVVQNRGPRPVNTIQAIQFDHYWSVPPVALQPGQEYRYIAPKDMRSEVWGIAPVFLALQCTLLFIGPLTTALREHDFLSLWVELALATLLLSVVIVLFCVRRTFISSFDDHFEAVPEGMRVTRGARSWIVRNPVPAQGFPIGLSLADEPVLKYRDEEGRAYYFEPRFIEEVP